MPQVQISRWGKGLGLRIPGDMAAGMDLRPGDLLEIRARLDGLLLAREGASRKRYRFKDILESFPDVDNNPMVDFGPPQGQEIW